MRCLEYPILIYCGWPPRYSQETRSVILGRS